MSTSNSTPAFSDTKLDGSKLVERQYANGRIVWRSRLYIKGKEDFEQKNNLPLDDGGDAYNRTKAKTWHDERKGNKKKRAKKISLDGITVRDLKNDFVAHCEEAIATNGGKSTGVSQKTLGGHKSHWNERIENDPIADVLVADFDKTQGIEFLDRLMALLVSRTNPNGLTNWTLSGTYSTLKRICRHGREYKNWEVDPFIDVPLEKKPKQKNSKRYTNEQRRRLTKEEAALFLDAAESAEFAAMTEAQYGNMLVHYTLGGQRSREGCGSRIGIDVDENTGMLRTDQQLEERSKENPEPGLTDPKEDENSVGILSMHTRHLAAVERQIAYEKTKGLGRHGDFLYTDPKGDPFTRFTVRAAVLRCAKLAGLGHVTTRDLRGTFATAVGHTPEIGRIEGASMTRHGVDQFENVYALPHRELKQQRENMAKLEATGFGFSEEKAQ